MRSLISRVCSNTALPESDADGAIRDTLLELRARLTEDEAALLSDGLPDEEHRAILRRPSGAVARAPADKDALFAGVAERLGVEKSIAAEIATAVCTGLACTASHDALTRLRRDLPPAFAVLFELPVKLGEPEAYEHGRVTTTLASGRPGSAHAVADSPPPAGQANTVATSNPHGDTKLSSAPALRQGRLRDDIASGTAGSTRPLSRAER